MAGKLLRSLVFVLLCALNVPISLTAVAAETQAADKPKASLALNKLTLMMIEKCEVNNTTQLTPAMLENGLKKAADETLYFDLKMLPSEFRQLSGFNPDAIDASEIGNPDFYLLNCILAKSEDRYDLSVNLRSTDTKAPLNRTLEVSQPVSNKAFTDVDKLMQKLWRRIDLPKSVIVGGIDLSGLWYDESDGRLVKIQHDKRTEKVILSLPWNRKTRKPIYRKFIEDEGKPEFPWRRVHGLFESGGFVLEEDISGVEVTAQYLEELSERVLLLSGKRGDGSVFQQRLRAVQPELDVGGAWTIGDGELIEMARSKVSPGRYTAQYLFDPPANSRWTKAEILLSGTRVYISFLKKVGDGDGFKLVERKEGELVWASDWEYWMMNEGEVEAADEETADAKARAKAEVREIRFEDGVWKFQFSA